MLYDSKVTTSPHMCLDMRRITLTQCAGSEQMAEISINTLFIDALSMYISLNSSRNAY